MRYTACFTTPKGSSVLLVQAESDFPARPITKAATLVYRLEKPKAVAIYKDKHNFLASAVTFAVPESQVVTWIKAGMPEQWSWTEITIDPANYYDVLQVTTS